MTWKDFLIAYLDFFYSHGKEEEETEGREHIIKKRG